MLRNKSLHRLCTFHHIQSDYSLKGNMYHNAESAGSHKRIVSFILTSCSHLSITNAITDYAKDFHCTMYNDNKGIPVFGFITCTKNKTHIHTHTPGKKMDIVVQLGLELTDAQADYSAFSGHMTLGLHAMVIKTGNNCDAFEKHFKKKSVLSFKSHIYNLIGDYKKRVCGQDSYTDKCVPVKWNATSM